MRIKGKVYKHRPYKDFDCVNLNYIGFIEIDGGIQLDGDMIKIIPILCEGSGIQCIIGERVEVDGEIEYKQIITLSGKRSLLPVPTLRVNTIDKVS